LLDRFNNPALLEQALRHRSAGKPHNERLEFLGDAVLGLLVSEALYAKFPNASEGEIRELLEGNICRCTGYQNIVRAVQVGQKAMASA